MRSLRSGLLAAALSPGADKESGRLSGELLLPPQVPGGIKERLHLRSHGPVPRRKPEKKPVSARQIRGGPDLRNRVVLGRGQHFGEGFVGQRFRHPVEHGLDAGHAVGSTLHPPGEALDVSVHRVEHYKESEIPWLLGRDRRKSFTGGSRGDQLFGGR